MKKSLVALLIMTLVFSGCASIMHGGGGQAVGISTNPAGATLTINGQKYTSPASIELRRNQNYVGTAEYPGYETASFSISKKVSGWVWGNIVFGGIIGLIIDFAIGGIDNLDPNNVTIDLKKKA